MGRRHEVTEGDSPVRGNVRKADKRVAVLAERKASPPRNAPAATYPPNTTYRGAYPTVGDDACDIPKRFRYVSKKAEQIYSFVGMTIGHPRMTGDSDIENVR